MHDHQEEHWIYSPHISSLEKISMFNEAMSHMKKLGAMEEKHRITRLIKQQIIDITLNDNVWDKEFIFGLKLIEGMIDDDIDKLKG